MKRICSPKFYGPLTIWPWLRISPHGSLNVIYCLIISDWQWLMSFTCTPCIPMQIKLIKSPLRNRFLALLLREIGHLSLPSRPCLGRLTFIRGGWGAPAGRAPPHTSIQWQRNVAIIHWLVDKNTVHVSEEPGLSTIKGKTNLSPSPECLRCRRLGQSDCEWVSVANNTVVVGETSSTRLGRGGGVKLLDSSLRQKSPSCSGLSTYRMKHEKQGVFYRK